MCSVLLLLSFLASHLFHLAIYFSVFFTCILLNQLKVHENFNMRDI